MRILVAIASYGTGNQRYLERVIAEYRSMPWSIDIVVVSEAAKSLPAGVEVCVGLPTPTNPRSLPFAHRRLFARRRDDYNLFVYSEDDTLVTLRNIEAFMAACDVLRADEIAGFMRSETDGDGTVYISSVHSFFRWDPSEIVARGNDLFAPFSNAHAACYMLTRGQLAKALDSEGFLLEPHEGRFGMLETAATDVYTRCGLRRLVSLSRFGDFVLPHLPNKYIGRLGVPLGEVEAEIRALERIAGEGGWRGPLLDIETSLPNGLWSKHVFERPDHRLLGLIPRAAQRVLSVAGGWGATEAALKSRGVDVAAIPVDPVFGDALRRRGIQTAEGDLAEALSQLPPKGFDCVLVPDVLHLLPDPVAWLSMLRPFLTPNAGRLVVSVPNTWDRVSLWRTTGSDRRTAFERPRSLGVQATNARRIWAWVEAAGFARDVIVPILNRKREIAATATLGLLRPVLAQRFLARASVRSA